MEKQSIRGILTFYGWRNPWSIDPAAGSAFDLQASFWDFIETHGRELQVKPGVDRDLTEGPGDLRAFTQRQQRDVYVLSADDGETYLEHGGRGNGVILLKMPGFGLSNVTAYLSSTLCALNRRAVEFSQTADTWSLAVDRAAGGDALPEVKYFGLGNSSRLVTATVEDTCRPGQHDCCCFLTMSARGWGCEKFNGTTAEMLLERVHARQMRATRIGNCRNTGREENSDG